MDKMDYIRRGTAEYHKANIALFSGGFCTFAIIWGTQPILPDIAEQYNITPAVSSLSVSVTIIALAISLLITSSISEAYGRKPIMTFALVSAAILTIFTGFAPTFELLLVFRALQGITLAGLPAVAMAYLGEEIEPRSLGLTMGLYISGNSVGGMSGRIISGVLTDVFNWQTAIIFMGVLGLAASIMFHYLLPASKHFEAKPLQFKPLGRSLLSHLKTPSLIYLFLLGFLAQGSFVSMFNYMGFELVKAPYFLSPTAVGFIFVVYIVGTFSSTWMGMLADQYGKRKILQLSLLIVLIGGAITLQEHLIFKIIGLAVFTFGFFASHSINSTWVGNIATHDKAQAASLYLFAYYVGGGVGGTISGVFYSDFGWVGVVGMIIVLSIISLLLSVRLGVVVRKKLELTPSKAQ